MASELRIENTGIVNNVIFDYYIDESNNKSIDDIRKISDKFTASTNVVYTHFFSSSSFWYKVRINNIESTPLEELLIIRNASWHDNIDFYIYSPIHKLKTYNQGGACFHLKCVH